MSTTVVSLSFYYLLYNHLLKIKYVSNLETSIYFTNHNFELLEGMCRDSETEHQVRIILLKPTVDYMKTTTNGEIFSALNFADLQLGMKKLTKINIQLVCLVCQYYTCRNIVFRKRNIGVFIMLSKPPI